MLLKKCCDLKINPHSFTIPPVRKQPLSVREVWGWNPAPVELVQCRQEHRRDVFSELCCPGAIPRRWAPPAATPYTLRRNTASMMRISLNFLNFNLVSQSKNNFTRGRKESNEEPCVQW